MGLGERLGGFPDQPILEDAAFCEKLVRVVTPVLLAPPALTDARKFVRMVSGAALPASSSSSCASGCGCQSCPEPSSGTSAYATSTRAT